LLSINPAFIVETLEYRGEPARLLKTLLGLRGRGDPATTPNNAFETGYR
jgi:hypothetical protein